MLPTYQIILYFGSQSYVLQCLVKWVDTNIHVQTTRTSPYTNATWILKDCLVPAYNILIAPLQVYQAREAP